jgi:hypothetical protein
MYILQLSYIENAKGGTCLFKDTYSMILIPKSPTGVGEWFQKQPQSIFFPKLPTGIGSNLSFFPDHITPISP